MKILLVNKFLFLHGGSEACLFDGARLLKERGHRVVFFSMHHPRNIATGDPTYLLSSVDFESTGTGARARAAARVLYSLEARALMERVVREERPDVALLHNVYHQLSPSILAPLRRHGVPVFMTLHDYKLVCPVYTLFRGGGPCERCRKRAFYWCALKRCNKGSLAKSVLSTAEMYLHHSLLHLYRGVTAFISPSRFLAAKLTNMGFTGTLHHVPHFLDVRGLDPQPDAREDEFVYFGRLTPEKGLATLVAAMEGVPATCHVIGDGPSQGSLEALVRKRGLANVRFTPHLPFPDLMERVRRAAAVVLPSGWYENSPRSVLEAFALGKPVVGANIGGIPELVRDGTTGLTFPPGDALALRAALLSLRSDRARVAEMGRNARRLVEEEHSPEAYYHRLMSLCRPAMERR